MKDRYVIASKLGEDILGSVYKADDTMLQRSVMMRHFENHHKAEDDDESWRKQFTQYAGKIGAIQHPNILTTYDISVKDDGARIVTQLVEGETLAERLEKGPLSQMGVYKMASDMLEVIHAAHEVDVFHGGLHTGSILRVNRASGGHRYILVDLGLNQLTSMVRAEQIRVADPVLMAPELLEEREPDAKADLFMLGQLCYTALVGGHPYSGKSAEECLEAYKNDNMPALDSYVQDVDPRFAAWIMKLIETDPEQRFADSAEAMVALHIIELNEPAPNVPGETNAVHEQTSSVA